MNNRTSGLAEAIATVYLIVFGLPGLVLAGYALAGLGRTGWSMISLPAWTTEVFAWAVGTSICGIAILSRGMRLPRGWRVAKSPSQAPWARLAPLLMSPGVVVALGSADIVGGGPVDLPIGAAVRDALPMFGWAVFVAMPVLIAVWVLFDLWAHLRGPVQPASPSVVAPLASSFSSRPDRDAPAQVLQLDETWDQRFARQRAARLAAQRSQASGTPGV